MLCVRYLESNIEKKQYQPNNNEKYLNNPNPRPKPRLTKKVFENP